MVGEAGLHALILAGLLALLLATLPMIGAARGRAEWMALARPLACGQALFVLVAWGCLLASFAACDFSLRNVAENANTRLPVAYRLAAGWGSHEGSMLLWLALHALWLLALAQRAPAWPPRLAARVLAVMGVVGAGLIAYLLAVSNPFARVFPVPLEGRDLNPLLQDPGMALHPPLLYAGYVGFTVALAFAVAALLGEGPEAKDGAWLRLVRPWLLAAWSALTLGVVVGSWWAYTELGWGGWWFWDPVENAALMPWLAGTALVHVRAAAVRQPRLRPLASLLAIGAFGLSLLGTFLVRSGVLGSVHAFALDPGRGVFILALLGGLVGGALALHALRGARGAEGAASRVPVRLAWMLAGAMLLVVAAASVLLGTLYPLALDALGLGRISVGAPYFDAVFAALMAPLLALMATLPATGASWQAALRASTVPLVAGLAGAALPALVGAWSAGPALGVGLACALAGSTLQAAIARRPAAGGGPGTAMTLAHLGVAVFVVGATLARGYETEVRVSMSPGGVATLAGRRLTFESVDAVTGPNYRADRGRFVVVGDGGAKAVALQPERRRYDAQPGLPTTESAIASSWTGDLYVVLGEALEHGAWLVQIQHKPFVGWLWAGGALMAAGGVLGAVRAAPWRRRRRRAGSTVPARDRALVDLPQPRSS